MCIVKQDLETTLEFKCYYGKQTMQYPAVFTRMQVEDKMLITIHSGLKNYSSICIICNHMRVVVYKETRQ